MVLPGPVNIAITAYCSFCRRGFLNSQSGLSDATKHSNELVIKIMLTCNFMNAILETLFHHCEIQKITKHNCLLLQK